MPLEILVLTFNINYFCLSVTLFISSMFLNFFFIHIEKTEKDKTTNLKYFCPGMLATLRGKRVRGTDICEKNERGTSANR